MLDSIRSSGQSWGVKIAFSLIIIVFVFWGVGSMQSTSVAVLAKVNDESVLVRDFAITYEQEVERLRQSFPDMSLEEMNKLGLKQQIFQQLVANELVRQEAERLGISVSPMELREVIIQIPSFHNADGKFDGVVYKEVLEAQRTSPGSLKKILPQVFLHKKCVLL